MTKSQDSLRSDWQVAQEMHRRLSGNPRIRYCEGTTDGKKCMTQYAVPGGYRPERTRVGRWRKTPYCDEHADKPEIRNGKGVKGTTTISRRWGDRRTLEERIARKEAFCAPALAYWRQHYGLSQKKLSELADVSKDTVRRLELEPENGGQRHYSSTNVLKKIARGIRMAAPRDERKGITRALIQAEPPSEPNANSAGKDTAA